MRLRRNSQAEAAKSRGKRAQETKHGSVPDRPQQSRATPGPKPAGRPIRQLPAKDRSTGKAPTVKDIAGKVGKKK